MKTYTDYYNSNEFLPGEKYAVRIVVSIGHHNDWAAYGGDTSKNDEEIARSGWKLDKDAAEALFPTLARQRNYRR